MSMEKITEDCLAAWNAHDVEKTASYYTDDCVYEDVAFGVVNRGKEMLKAFINQCFATYPDLKFELKSFLVSGQRTVFEWVMSGSHTVNLPKSPIADKSLPATGKSFSVRGISISEFDKMGKIRQNTDYYDRASILRQLGM